MPGHAPNAFIMAEARRLAAEHLDRDLDHVAQLLAESGHHGPDGRAYPARTVMNLLDDDLRRTRDARLRERNRPAPASNNQWIREHGDQFATVDEGEIDGSTGREAREGCLAKPAVFGRLADGGPRPAPGEEAFLDLLTAPGGARVERILSHGAASPEDFWYEQEWDEFVLVVSGTAVLAFPDGGERRLQAGDYAILPAFCRHRVAWTDPTGDTLWLAIHMPPRSRNAAVAPEQPGA